MIRYLLDLRKAQQLGLFGGGRPPPTDDRPKETAAPARPPPPVSTTTTKPAVGAHPDGPGWMPILASRHGGFHRKTASGDYEYWYPGEGARATPKDLADGFELRPQTAGTPTDGSGRKVHHDVGEKVGGAKKDKWAEVHGGNLDALEAEGTSEAYKRCTKEAVLGKHDPALDRALGDSAGASFIKAAIYRSIAARPFVPSQITKGDPTGSAFSKLFGFGGEKFSADSRLARAVYVSGIDKLKKGLAECHTPDEIDKFLDDIKDLAVNGKFETEEVVTGDIARQLASTYPKTRSWTGSTQYVYWGKGADRDHVEIDQHAMERAGYRVAMRNGTSYLRKMSPNIEDRARPNLEAIVLGERFYKGVLQSRYDGAFGDARRAGQAYGDDWAKAFPEAKPAETGGKKEPPQRFVLTRGHGTPERTGGATVPKFLDGQKFAAAFGLRAVEYGNWVDDKDAGKHLEHAYGALLDLADLMGVEPKQLAHGAKLAMAFGARGGGNAGAHYEPDRQIINLTHTRGGGTLAHEWGHFMDHMMAGGGLHAGEMAAASHGQAESASLAYAFADVMRAIHQAPAKKSSERLAMEAAHNKRYDELVAERKRLSTLRGDERATASKAYNEGVDAWKATRRVLDKTANRSKFSGDATMLGDYWERPHELFARAFESWAEDRLKDKGRLNTYLVTDTSKRWNVSKVIKGELVEGLEPYPYGEERKQIHRAIDKLVEEMAKSGALRKALRRAMFRPPPAGARIHRLELT